MRLDFMTTQGSIYFFFSCRYSNLLNASEIIWTIWTFYWQNFIWFPLTKHGPPQGFFLL